MNNIISLYGDNRFHPDFGQDYHDASDLYGIPINVVHGNTAAKATFVIDAYPDESDLIPAPIPPHPVIEGDLQNGPKVGVDNRGDSHLLIWDEDNNIAYEFYRASRPSENADGKWHADGETVWNMNTDNFRTLGWTSADAAGLSILAGLARPDEGLPVSQGGQGVINHALRFTLQNNIILDKYLYPASHHANSGTNTAIQPPMGARFRLKASVDISQLNPEARIVAQAMKDYGLIVADNGSNFFLSGASYSVDANNNVALTWDDNDIQDSTHGLKSLHFSDFEMVDLTPAVSGLSSPTASTGSQLTIAGHNFSGAAGRLQVFFGATPATSVNVVDDSHVVVTVPSGSGTVNITVQSGVTVAASPYNFTSPIFGYGKSANTAADDFTFVPPGPQPPTVVNPASATLTSGKTAALHVLGADDGGEANLTYTWAASAKPAGAADPTYSANGTNAAKNSTATVSKAGAYRFQVTITDKDGMTATSSVNLVVMQQLTRLTLLPGTVDVPRWGVYQFTATALDQFDDPMTTQPRLMWRLTGRGSLTSSGLYYAPGQRGGPYTITVIYGRLSASATVQVV
jgi:hypothetical protein